MSVMRLRTVVSAVALVAATSCGAPASDHELLPLISSDGEFKEDMPDIPRVSGHRLAGVHIGDGSGLFDPLRFRIALGAGVEGHPVCVRVSTRDGRYWALNPFGTKNVAAQNPAIDFRTHLSDRLSDYDLSEFAVKAVVADTCKENASGPIVPARLGSGDDALVLFVNAGNPLSVGAAFGNLPAVDEPVRCERPERSAMVSYNFVCRLPIGQRSGEENVTVAIRDMNGVSLPMSFVVRLP